MASRRPPPPFLAFIGPIGGSSSPARRSGFSPHVGGKRFVDRARHFLQAPSDEGPSQPGRGPIHGEGREQRARGHRLRGGRFPCLRGAFPPRGNLRPRQRVQAGPQVHRSDPREVARRNNPRGLRRLVFSRVPRGLGEGPLLFDPRGRRKVSGRLRRRESACAGASWSWWDQRPKQF